MGGGVVIDGERCIRCVAVLGNVWGLMCIFLVVFRVFLSVLPRVIVDVCFRQNSFLQNRASKSTQMMLNPL